ncbi:hypothetical protein IJS77_04855 [bacterium]|nr:hypothetical protein [bacterium]
MNKKVYAFDLGKASIGFCAREDFNILDIGSLIIDKDHAEVISNRERRRIKKTLDAHKNREEFFDKLWLTCGLSVLEKSDKRFKTEFALKNDETVYNSTLLRIALLQNKPLKEWQIYKALHSAIQRRGYDPDIVWANASSSDEKNNKERVAKYTQNESGQELIINEEYKYPCYYDALKLGLWSEDKPQELKRHIPLANTAKVRTTERVAPRSFVEKELTQLYLNAQKQLPQLKFDVEYFLYGEKKKAYATFRTKEQGREKDYGVLGQKIPRFDNRIIAKCKLLPKRNVCKAADLDSVTFTLLMKLKNLRFTDINGEKGFLDSSAISEIHKNWLVKANKGEKIKLDTTVTKKDIEDVIGVKIQDKIEPMKANISGRSSFCRRACQIMNKIILEGIENPVEMDLTEYIDPNSSPNGITEEEIREMLYKIGTWDNLFIPDNRYEMVELSSDDRQKTDLLIGKITNPIVRNRLQILRDKLLELKKAYGTPDEVIFEFIREGADNSLFGAIKAQDALKRMKDNEKKNEELGQKLKDNNIYSSTNFDKLKLLEIQGGKSVYSGKPIGIENFDECEIDHIYPRTMGGNDALYNKVLCYSSENQEKAGRTPYEWLSPDKDKWAKYVNRLSDIKSSLGKKKFELLTSKPETCEKLIESYNGLAETAQIAKVAQQLAAFIFGWGLQTVGDKRHLFVNNGSTTAAIRRRYGLNKILGDDVKKNRENDKHHALDAICISFSRDFKYDPDSKKDVIKGFTYEFVKNEIDKLMPYPYSNDKPFKGNTKPLETIYGYREYGSKKYITGRVDITELEQKEKKIKTIIDEIIKNDLLEKINLPKEEWVNLLKNYIHPKKQTHVKKVMVVVSEGEIDYDSNNRMRMGEYVDFGKKETEKSEGAKHQFKHSKGHKGQILYYDEKGVIKVMPVYANKKTSEVKQKLLDIGCKLYKKGMMFTSGCLVEIPKDFDANVYYHKIDENGKDKLIPNKELVKNGIFKVRTIMSNGAIKLENNCGQEILTSVSVLTNIEFKKYKP